MGKNIALFGGSFNPPHIGHQMMLLYLAHSYQFDAIWVYPVFHHPFAKEQTLIPFQHRLEMSKIAFEKIAPHIVISSIEKQYQTTRTFDLLTKLSDHHLDTHFTLILGEDQFPVRHKWYQFEKIEKMVDMIYLGRTGITTELALPFKFPEISSTAIRSNIIKNRDMMDHAVLNYIQQYQLYGTK